LTQSLEPARKGLHSVHRWKTSVFSKFRNAERHTMLRITLTSYMNLNELMICSTCGNDVE
jgi:hypothetical protein